MPKQFIFVYNADAGILNMAADWLHKIVSPKTYPCSLCALTYGHFGEKKEWRQFLEELSIDAVFLHKDEFEEQYPGVVFELPCVLVKENDHLSEALSASDMNTMKTLSELKSGLRRLTSESDS